jgi:hypothetical protein
MQFSCCLSLQCNKKKKINRMLSQNDEKKCIFVSSYQQIRPINWSNDEHYDRVSHVRSSEIRAYTVVQYSAARYNVVPYSVVDGSVQYGAGRIVCAV